MKFKPEDFCTKRGIQKYVGDTVYGKVVNVDEAAEIANAKLAEWLESAPVIYGWGAPGYLSTTFWNTGSPIDRTHKGRLVCIEELPKQPCKHEPQLTEWRAFPGSSGLVVEPICKHCGVELTAVWTAK